MRGAVNRLETRPVWPEVHPAISLISGRLTGRARYQSEAWILAVILQSSPSPKTDRNAAVCSTISCGKSRPFSPSIPPILGDATAWILILSSSLSFSDYPRHLKPPFGPRTTAGKLAAWEARSAAIDARGKSPLALLDSAWLELSDLSFPATVDWREQFGNLTFWGQLCNFWPCGYFTNLWNWG